MNTKQCSKCKEIKLVLEFSVRSDSRKFLSSCKSCERVRSAESTKKSRSTLIGKFKAHQKNAERRKIPFLLTYEEWLKIWVDSGKLEQRGRGADKYCMCRIGDVGSYEVNNVFIGTGKENVRAGNLGKKCTEDVRQKISVANKGKPHPWVAGIKNPMHRQDVKVKMSLAIGGANHYKAIGVTTPNGYFDTAKQASEALGIKKSTIEWRSKHKKFGFSYGKQIVS